MRCSTALDQIASPAQPAQELLEHIEECRACRQSFVTAQKISEVLSQPISAPSHLVKGALSIEVAPFGFVMDWRQKMKRNSLPIAATTLAIAVIAILIPRQASAAPDPIEKMREALKKVPAVHSITLDSQGNTTERWVVDGKIRIEDSRGFTSIITPTSARHWMKGKEDTTPTPPLKKRFQPSNILEDHIREGLEAKDLGPVEMDGKRLRKVEIIVPGLQAIMGGGFGQGTPKPSKVPDQRLTFFVDDHGLPHALNMEVKKDGEWAMRARFRYEYLNKVPDSWFEGLERR